MYSLYDYLGSEMLDDFWYDDAILFCEDILKSFDNKDWEELYNIIPKQSNLWKKRLVECLGDINSEMALLCIFILSKDNDKDIFIACIDAIKDKNIPIEYKDEIKFIVMKVKKIRKKCSVFEKIILDDFIKKMINFSC